MRIFIPVFSCLLLNTLHWVSAHSRRTDCEGDDKTPSRYRRHGHAPPREAEYAPEPRRYEYAHHEMPADMAPINRQSTAPRSENCSTACQYRDKIKEYKLDLIKDDILRKLRLQKPPNRTRPDVPDIPGQMRHILEKFGMVNDEPERIPPIDGGDDYHSTTSLVINFGKSRKYIYIHLHLIKYVIYCFDAR